MFKDIGKLSGSIAIGAIMNIAALPFLARFYDPIDFSEYGVLVAVLSIVSVVSCLRLDQAVLVASESEANKFMGTGFFVALSFSSITLVISMVFYTFAFYLAIACLSNALFQLLYSYFMREGRIGLCSIMNILRVVFLLFPQIVLALFYEGASLLHGLLFQSLSVIVLFFVIFRSKVFVFDLMLIKRNKDFVVFSSPHAILNSLSHNSPYFFCSFFLGPVLTGYYVMIDRIMKSPISLFSQVVRQLYIKKVGQSGSGSVMAKECVGVSIVMLVIGAPVFISIALVPDGYIEIILGEGWGGIKPIAIYLGLAYAFVFSNPPVSAYLIALRKSDNLLKFQVVELAAKALTFLFLFWVFGDEKALAAIAASALLYNFLIWNSVANDAKVPVSSTQ